MTPLELFTYVSIKHDTTATETNYLDMVISKFILREGEIFKIHGHYNYLDTSNNKLWNTSHPIVEIYFEECDFKVYYKLKPGSYHIVKINRIYLPHINFTEFKEVDLVEREESMFEEDIEREKECNFIFKAYLTISNSFNLTRPKSERWPNTYEYLKP